MTREPRGLAADAADPDDQRRRLGQMGDDVVLSRPIGRHSRRNCCGI